MNNDTLEFNPEAFKLNKNAVVEDLFRRLHGVKIWGDGKITVNGKEVKAIFVNGKQFFSSDYKIALQNIPNAAVEKVQVYSSATNDLNLKDSITNINIKLKKGSQSGLFGKLSAGGGTGRHYQFENILNYYDKRTQISAAQAQNNVNIEDVNIETVQQHTTFKGFTGIGDYTSNFRLPGQRVSNFAGIKADYDLNNKISQQNHASNITLEISRSKQNADEKNNLRSSNFIDTKNIAEFNTNNDRHSNEEILNAASDYTFKNDKNKLVLHSDFSKKALNQKFFEEIVSRSNNKITSIGSNINKLSGNENTFNTTAGFTNIPKHLKGMRYNFDFKQQISSNSNQEDRQLYYESVTDNTQNNLKRNYDFRNNELTNYVGFQLENIEKLLKIRRADLWPISISNTLSISGNNSSLLVEDNDAATNTYSINENLSNEQKLKVIDNQFSVNIKRRFSKFFFNRFNRELYVQLSAKEQSFFQKNSSTLDFQNLTKRYNNFIPALEVSHTYNRFNRFLNTAKLLITSTVGYPDIQQLVPLVDSINIYYLTTGNKELRPFRRNSVNASYTHWNQKSGQDLRYSFRIVTANIQHPITRNETIDGSGRITMNFMNADYENQLSFSGSFEKGLRIGSILTNIRSQSEFRLANRPLYFNQVYYRGNSAIIQGSISMAMAFRNLLQSNIEYNFGKNKFQQKQDIETSTTFHTLQYNQNINMSKRISFNSNLEYNTYRSSLGTSDKFVILNASASYRALKNNSLEFKIAMLDIFNNNRTVINEIFYNSIVTGSRNMLRQYCMLSASFYPRNFKLTGSK
jgi:hypothetical protein